MFGEYLRAVELVLEDLGQGEELFWGGPELLAVVQGRRSRRARTIGEDVARQVATAAGRLQARYQHPSPDESGCDAGSCRTKSAVLRGLRLSGKCLACGSDGLLGVGIDVGWELDNGEMVPHANTSPAMFHALCAAWLWSATRSNWAWVTLNCQMISIRASSQSLRRTTTSGHEYGARPRVSGTLIGDATTAPINWWRHRTCLTPPPIGTYGGVVSDAEPLRSPHFRAPGP